jgi:hypothetical protein
VARAASVRVMTSAGQGCVASRERGSEGYRSTADLVGKAGEWDLRLYRRKGGALAEMRGALAIGIADASICR